MDFFNNISEYLSELHSVTVIVRVLLAALAGGLIGLERGFHGRAAGLRTHMLVCLGAALTALIGCFLANDGLTTDVQRTGAQVMSGVGFLGAGTILLKKENSKITGLTTAAGLWATAAIGLAVGYGLYVAAFSTVVLVVFSFTFMSRVEFRMHGKRQKMFAYIELDSVDAVREFTQKLREDFGAVEIQVTPARSGNSEHVGMEALIKISQKGGSADRKIDRLHQIEHVVFALPIV
jgi:putative Mg2+ transporter-C (MgtC) family protein